MIAMAGMFFSGDKTFMSFAIGTMMVVAVAMIGSLTVLPATLSWLGDRVDKVRVPFLGRRQSNRESRIWGAILGAVLRRPLVSAIGAAAVLVVLALPALKLHTTQSGFDALPKSMKEVQSLNAVRDAFPGGATPAVVAIKGDATDPKLQAAVDDLEKQALASGKALDPIYSEVSPDGSVVRVSSRSSARARTTSPTTPSPPSARTSCRRRWARSPVSSTRSPVTRPRPRTGTTR